MHRVRRNRVPIRAASSWPGMVLLALVCSGCTTVQEGGPQKTALMEATGAQVNAGDLRAVDNALAISVPGAIETAANRIAVGSTDSQVRRRALLWKIEVVPAFYQAFFYTDPLGAMLDAWALSIQVEERLASQAASEELGPLQPLATEAARTIRMQIEAAAKGGAKTPAGFEKAKQYVESWARSHPIIGPFSSRPSILPELVQKAAGGLDTSVFQAVANIPATVADIATRLDIYAAYLPKAGRWQAELLTDELAERSDSQQVMATFESIQKMTGRINALLTPEDLQAALDLARREVRAEGNTVLTAIDQQRVETLSYMTRERGAVVADIDRQRVTLLRELDELRGRSLRDVEDLSTRLIRRAALATALLLVLAAALAFAVVRLAPRKETGAA